VDLTHRFVTLRVIQAVLGRQSITTTEIYLHLMPETITAAMDATFGNGWLVPDRFSVIPNLDKTLWNTQTEVCGYTSKNSSRKLPLVFFHNSLRLRPW